jgi:aurora kinase
LGKGRFGDVFIARHRATGFALAIKVMDKAELLESDMQAQLAQEIKTQTYCSHPNILKMYGCFSVEQNIYLLLELGTHHSLFHDLKLNRHFPE